MATGVYCRVAVSGGLCEGFRAAWPHLMPSGFDDRFRRLWEYYLAYCEAGFLSGNIDVRQVVFAKSG